MKVTSTEVQNSFGKYLNLLEYEDIIITKNNRNIAKLIPYEEKTNTLIKEHSGSYAIKKRITYEEYVALVENSEERYELIDGEIYLMASPLFKHQVAVNEIAGSFYIWFKGKSCRSLTSPFDVKLFNHAKKFEDDQNVVQPDVLVMCDEEKVTNEGKYEGKPTLVVEVLSKSTRSKDMIKKLNLYMNSGIREYWIVDTEKKEVYVYYFEESDIHSYDVFTKDMTVESKIFQGLKIALDDIFTW